MKSWCAIIIAALILHLQCSGFCLSESLRSRAIPATGDPPCHQHSGNSSSPERSPHPANNPCSQGPVVALKSRLAVKYACPVISALPVALVEIVNFDRVFDFRTVADNSPSLGGHSAVSSVLRI